MLTILLPLAVAIAGLLVFAFTANQKIERLSLVTFGIGLFLALAAVAHETLHI